MYSWLKAAGFLFLRRRLLKAFLGGFVFLHRSLLNAGFLFFGGVVFFT